MHENKGAYALLLGSGISRSAEVPTGAEIISDLIRRVAHLEGAYCEPDPIAWWQARGGGKPPNYSELIEQLAHSTHDRHRLLRRYFEPTTDEERERGVKQPTAAHRAAAELVKRGVVRVIVTTNFDRLLEHALEDLGVVPTVIATDDAIQGAPPLVHSPCTVVKLHGDYVDVRIRNTVEELEGYSEPLNRLLDRIFDEYGLVVCGWSAQWDDALRAALTRCPSRRYTTFWMCRDPQRLSDEANRLIGLRRAHVIPSQDADAFFQRLSEHVVSLEEFHRPHPHSAKLAQITLQRFLENNSHPIRAHELVIEEVNRVYEKLTAPPEGGYALLYTGDPTGEGLVHRLGDYEGWTETLRALMASGCYWGGETQHDLWMTCLERLATLPEIGGTSAWLNLRRYPALLALYAGGIAAIAGKRYDTLNALLTSGRVRRNNRDEPLVLTLNTYVVMHPDVAKLVPGQERKHIPFSDYLYGGKHLWAPLRELMPVDQRFEECFDRFEYLLGLVQIDMQQQGQQRRRGWAPPGNFLWKKNVDSVDSRIVELITEELDSAGADWPPLQGGFFGGSLERVTAAKSIYDDLLRAMTRGFGIW